MKAAHEELEEKVKSRTKDLREANRQLERDKDQLIEFYKYLGVANRKISVLLDLYRDPNGKRSRQSLFSYIISTVLNLSHASEGLLYGYDENQKFFKLLKAQNAKNENISSSIIISAKDNAFLKAFRKNPRRIDGRIEEDSREIFNSGDKLKYFLALPLEKDKKLIGLILLGFRSKRNINPQDFEFYDIFTIIASQTIANGNI